MRIRVSSVAALVAVSLTICPGSASAEKRSIDFVTAITSPFLNESPYIRTEARPIFMYTALPDAFISEGGYINVFALQLRWAINDRVAVMITKNGYVDANFSSLLPDDDGKASFAAGVKYALLANPDTGSYLTVGGKYEFPTASLNAGQLNLSGDGDGLIDLFTSYGARVGDRTGFQASAGFNLALDSEHDSSFFHSHLHLDVELIDRLYGVLETNIVTTIEKGNRTPSSIVGGFEGYDLFNFGNDSSGTVATFAFGGRYRLTDHFTFGAAYEVPITSRKDIIDYRLMMDLIAHL